MVKTTLSISVESEIADRIKEIAEMHNEKISVVAGKVLEVGLKVGEPVNIICPICSNVYSNKDGFCPRCKKEIENKEEQLKLEKNIENLKYRLDKLKEWKDKGFMVTDREFKATEKRLRELEHAQST